MEPRSRKSWWVLAGLLFCLLMVCAGSAWGQQQQPPAGFVVPVAPVAKQSSGQMVFWSVDNSGNLFAATGAGGPFATGQPNPTGYVVPYAPVAQTPSGAWAFLKVDASGNLQTSGASGGPFTTNGILFGNGTSVIQVTAAGGAGTLCLVETNGGLPTFGSCSGTASTLWSALTAPTASLSITMPAGDITTLTWAAQASPATSDFSWVAGADTGVASASIFAFLDTTGNVRTGPLLDVHTVGTSSALPVRITAQGTANGVQMSTAGLLAAIGTGGINATQVNGAAVPTSATVLGSNGSNQLVAATTTGSGSAVLATSPTLVTPNLGTPSAAVLTNATGLPVGAITGLGTGVATFLATPSSGNLAAAVTGETGSGSLVFAGSPTLTGTVSAVNITLTGLLTTAASAAGGAGLNLPHGVAPTTPNNGDLWTTTAGLFAQINGATVGPFGTGGAGGTPAGSSGNLQYNNAGAFGGFGTTISGSNITFPGSITATTLTLTGQNSFTIGTLGQTPASFLFLHSGNGASNTAPAYLEGASSPGDATLSYLFPSSLGGWCASTATPAADCNNILSTDGTVNAQTGTSYNVASSDRDRLVTLSNSGAVSVALPDPNATTFAPGWRACFVNLGAGAVTIAPTTKLINGAASVVLNTNGFACPVSDGTNYSATVGGSGTGTVTHTAGALTLNAVMIGNGAADATVLASLGTSGQPLLSGGVGSPPAFGALDISTAAVTGNLGVSHLNSGTLASSTTFWRGDGTWATPATSSVAWSALTAPGGTLTLGMAANPSLFNWTGGNQWQWDTGGNPIIGLTSYTTAVQNSPTLTFAGSYQNAATPTFAEQTFACNIVVGAGTNGTANLTCTPSGTTGAAGYELDTGGAAGSDGVLLLKNGTHNLSIDPNGASNQQVFAPTDNVVWNLPSGKTFTITGTGGGPSVLENCGNTSTNNCFSVKEGTASPTGSTFRTLTSTGAINFSILKGIVSNYNATATAGQGVSWIPCVTSQKAETTADAAVLSCTPASAVGTYKVHIVMSVSAASSATLGWTATWTDSNGNADAPTNLSLFQDGTAAPALTFTTSAAGTYEGFANVDVNSAGTAIVVKTTFSGTSIAYKVSAWVERVI